MMSVQAQFYRLDSVTLFLRSFIDEIDECFMIEFDYIIVEMFHQNISWSN